MISSRLLYALKKSFRVNNPNWVKYSLGQQSSVLQHREYAAKKKEVEEVRPIVNDPSWQWKPRKDLEADCPDGPKCKPSFFPRFKKKYVRSVDKTNNFVRKPKKRKTFKEVMTIIIRDYLMAKKEKKVPLYMCKVVHAMRMEKCKDNNVSRPVPDWYGRSCKCKIPVGGSRPWSAKPGSREETMSPTSNKPKPSAEQKPPESKTQEAKTEESKTEESKTEESKTKGAKTKGAKTKVAKPKKPKTPKPKKGKSKKQASKAEESKDKASKPEESKTQESKAEASKTEESKEEDSKAEDSKTQSQKCEDPRTQKKETKATCDD